MCLHSAWPLLHCKLEGLQNVFLHLKTREAWQWNENNIKCVDAFFYITQETSLNFSVAFLECYEMHEILHKSRTMNAMINECIVYSACLHSKIMEKQQRGLQKAVYTGRSLKHLRTVKSQQNPL